jgi:hypothetical protein
MTECSPWKRRILLTVSSAPVKGTPMIMTEAYRRILARAAHGQLPPWVVEQSEPDFRVIRALYEEKCLGDFRKRSYSGRVDMFR